VKLNKLNGKRIPREMRSQKGKKKSLKGKIAAGKVESAKS
jgi:hypothetical protein